jgi:eukaryotic-like serine/threonine-protein kinase
MSGRYTILGTLASGGMATVYLGRMMGSAGFSRPVAIKRLHPELAAQRDFVAMLVDEARLAAQVRHTNVIDTLDLVAKDGAFNLVLEYVEGDSLSTLVRNARMAGDFVPRPVALAILYGVLRGLDAAHDARNEEGQPLGIVHRDVSPQNILVGIDGIPRIIDFGVAKALGRIEETRPGEVRGKFSYMAPEQMLGRPVTRQVDVYASGVLLWELLTGQRLFTGDDQRTVCAAVLRGAIDPPSRIHPDVPRELDAIVAKATAREVSDRYLTAREFLDALEPFETASDDEVGVWVRRLSAERLAQRSQLLQEAVSSTSRRTIDDLLHDLAQSTLADTHAQPHAPVAPHPVSFERGGLSSSPRSLHPASFSAPPTMIVGSPSAGGVEVFAPPSAVGAGRTRPLHVALAVAGVLMLVGLLVGLRHLRPSVASGASGTKSEAPVAAASALPVVASPVVEPSARPVVTAMASEQAPPRSEPAGTARVPKRPVRKPTPRPSATLGPKEYR